MSVGDAADWDRRSNPAIFDFGPYRLIPARRLLLHGTETASIGNRAFDLLTMLVQNAGSLVSKEELVAAVWPTTHVHEANLRVHVGGLRKMLRDGQAGVRYIVSEAGRGYRFVAPVTAGGENADDSFLPQTGPAPESSSGNATPVFGRAGVIETIVEQLPKHRFVTLVGPGGIGKTTVALAVAEAVAQFHEVCFVDLGPLSDPSLVTSKLMSTLGCVGGQQEPVPEILQFVGAREMLIVFDTCEHVLETVAPLISTLLAGAQKIQVLATSREPLRGRGESVRRLAPLECPRFGAASSAQEAMRYAAVQLFVERAGSSLNGFELTQGNSLAVTDICRKLDGLPLAIELAAGRIDTFGLKGLTDLLNRKLPLPALGRRNAPARHRTLDATLDWSYETLPDEERVMLRRLAVFPGAFSLDAALRVAGQELSGADAVDTLANLVESSLVSADLRATDAEYRLLDTTRAYAVDKLRRAGEFHLVSRRHAEYFCRLFEQTQVEREKTPGDWVAAHRDQIDDIRVALDWAFSVGGDAAMGVVLTRAAIPFWTHLSLSDEACIRVHAALDCLDPEDPSAARTRMEFWTALGGAMVFAGGVERNIPVWSNALAIAESIGDFDFQIRAYWGICTFAILEGDFSKALKAGQSLAETAEAHGTPSDVLLSRRMRAIPLHFMGEQIEARRHLEHVLAHLAPEANYMARFQFDQRVFSRVYLPMILWLLGFSEAARRNAEITIAEGAQGDHTISLIFALAECACPIAFRTGDLPLATKYLDILLARSANHGAATWSDWARAYQGILLIEQGRLRSGIEILREKLHTIPKSAMRMQYLALLCHLAEALRRDDRLVEARLAMERALELGRRDNELWIMPELLRIDGEIAKAAGQLDDAERKFQESREMAQAQKALAWELRGAMSLARLRRDQGRSEEARALLAPVYGRFTESFETKDLRAAAALLAELEAAG